MAIQEFDDPNTTITNILDHARQIGVAIDFAPSKLKQVSVLQLKFHEIIFKLHFRTYYVLMMLVKPICSVLGVVVVGVAGATSGALYAEACTPGVNFIHIL